MPPDSLETVVVTVDVTIRAQVSVPAAQVPDPLPKHLNRCPDALLASCRTGWAAENSVDPSLYDIAEEVSITAD